ncbi:MAG: hypothetical protein SAK29_30940 [Scytonema sp. PMC 1069.18]|nr:hypothetical protein [Scytonema sp. PMC 1069.18]MEC4887760.1 hypothetical protein [Scytonema sp. PMC 1070.18]
MQYIPFAALADLNYQPSSTQGKEEKPKHPSCVGGGISNCQKDDSPINRFDYQPLFVNHEIVNLPSASAIAQSLSFC